MANTATAHDVRSGAPNDIDSLRAQSARTLTVATVASAAAWLSALAHPVSDRTAGGAVPGIEADVHMVVQTVDHAEQFTHKHARPPAARRH